MHDPWGSSRTPPWPQISDLSMDDLPTTSSQAQCEVYRTRATDCLHSLLAQDKRGVDRIREQIRRILPKFIKIQQIWFDPNSKIVTVHKFNFLNK
jgi:hypothetical protein